MPDLWAVLRQVFWGRYTRWLTIPVVVMIVAGMVLLSVSSGTSWAPLVYAN